MTKEYEESLNRVAELIIEMIPINRRPSIEIMCNSIERITKEVLQNA